MMQHLQAEAERARRLAAAAYDSRLVQELIAYAAELEQAIERKKRDRAHEHRVNL